MNHNEISSFFEIFPISGEDACKIMLSMSSPQEKWLLNTIETLSNSQEEILGQVWRKTRKEPIILSTEEMLLILGLASQVIDLDVENEKEKARRFVIEDGYLVQYLDRII